MPSPEQCVLTGQVLNQTATDVAPAGTKVYVKRVRLGQYALSSRRTDFVVNSDGELETSDGEPASLPQGAVVTLQGSVEGLQGETDVTIPALAEYEFRLLLPAISVTVGSVTAGQLADVQAAVEAEEAAREAADAIFTQTIDEDATLNIGAALRALILIDSSAGDVTATLQPAADMANREITFKKIADEHLAIVDGNASETIDGQLVFNLEMNMQTVKVVPIGSAWYVV